MGRGALGHLIRDDGAAASWLSDCAYGETVPSGPQEDYVRTPLAAMPVHRRTDRQRNIHLMDNYQRMGFAVLVRRPKSLPSPAGSPCVALSKVLGPHQ